MNVVDDPPTLHDGPWSFAAEPVCIAEDQHGNMNWVIPVRLTELGRLPVLLMSNTQPDGSWALYKNGPAKGDYRQEFIDYLDNWLIRVGLPPGDHRLDVWVQWQFYKKPGQTEREVLSDFYDRVARHGTPPPGPKWSTSDSDSIH